MGFRLMYMNSVWASQRNGSLWMTGEREGPLEGGVMERRRIF